MSVCFCWLVFHHFFAHAYIVASFSALPYFIIRMESLLAWKCFSPKMPNSTQRTTRLFSTTSSSTKSTTETQLLLLNRLQVTATTLTPPLTPFQNHQNHLNHPGHPSHPSHPNTLRSTRPVIESRCQGGTPRLAATPHQAATPHPVATLHLGATPPPTIHPPTTHPANINTSLPPLLSPLPRPSYAIPGAGRSLRGPSAQGLAESTSVDTSVPPPPPLTSPSRLRRPPG